MQLTRCSNPHRHKSMIDYSPLPRSHHVVLDLDHRRRYDMPESSSARLNVTSSSISLFITSIVALSVMNDEL